VEVDFEPPSVEAANSQKAPRIGNIKFKKETGNVIEP
jgi:hypothetical protein